MSAGIPKWEDLMGYEDKPTGLQYRLMQAEIVAYRALAALPQQSQVTGQAVPEGDALDPVTINMGYGLIEVGQGHHGHDRLPAILFGRNGAGAVGVETEGDRVMEPGECIVALTFANPESLDVVAEKLAELRARIWPAAPEPAQQNAGTASAGQVALGKTTEWHGRDCDLLTMQQVNAIRDTIKPGDGWDGDNWDFALANAVASAVAAPSAPQQAVPGEAPSGSWLWCKLMDWCKKRGVAPANYDDLFAIAKEAHRAAPQQAVPGEALATWANKSTVHAKVECLFFNTEDVRLVLTDRNDRRELRMHNDDAWFIVEAIHAANHLKVAAPDQQAVPGEDYEDCPACIGSSVRGEKRGVRCTTCNGTGTVAAPDQQAATPSATEKPKL